MSNGRDETEQALSFFDTGRGAAGESCCRAQSKTIVGLVGFVVRQFGRDELAREGLVEEGAVDDVEMRLWVSSRRHPHRVPYYVASGQEGAAE